MRFDFATNGIPAILASLCAAISTFLFSHNWACATIPAGAAALALSLAANRIFLSGPSTTLLRLLAAITIGLMIGLVPPFRLSPAAAFKAVFGFAPSEQIQNLTAESHYKGGFGDHSIILTFRTDASTFESILSKTDASRSVLLSQIWYVESVGSWDKFLSNRNVAMLDRHYRCGQILRQNSMHEPRFFSIARQESEHTLLIRDAANGRVIALFVEN